jgi:hypothetical protein
MILVGFEPCAQDSMIIYKVINEEKHWFRNAKGIEVR